MKCGDYDLTLVGAIIQVWKDETLVGWLPAMVGEIQFKPENAEWAVSIRNWGDGRVALNQFRDEPFQRVFGSSEEFTPNVAPYISPEGGWDTAKARYHDAREAGLAELGEDVILKPGDIDLTKARYDSAVGDVYGEGE